MNPRSANLRPAATRLPLPWLLLLAILLLPWTFTSAAEKIDLNRADAAALESLPGIGPKKAREIVRHRKENGPFEQWDDLLEVKGIGEKTLQKIRKRSSLTGGVSRLKKEPKKAKKKSRKAARKNSGEPATAPREVRQWEEPETIPWYSYGDPPIRARR